MFLATVGFVHIGHSAFYFGLTFLWMGWAVPITIGFRYP
jgi:hypothetical protein